MTAPKTIEELSEFLKNRNATPLHLTGSQHDHASAETLSTSNLIKIILYEPEETIISVESGITLLQLDETLSSKGQWIPTLVTDENPEDTLGAAIACDHYHPRASSLGALRTSILGGTFCTTDGEVFKSGSRVVKSVAGYDIHRAFCGSQGLFGVIVNVTLKVQPLPEMFFHFTAPLTERKKILDFHPTIVEESHGELFVELAGFKEDVEADKTEIERRDIVSSLIDAEQAAARIKEIALHKKKIAVVENSPEHRLLTSVRRVFDPKGVLV